MNKFTKVFAVALVVVMTLTVLAACGYSSDPEKAVAQLEKRGYLVKEFYPPFGNGVDAIIDGYKEDDRGYTLITITYYPDIDKAKYAYWKEKVPEDTDSRHGIKKTVSRHGKQVVVKRVFYEI